jgi:hypothetical protein
MQSVATLLTPLCGLHHPAILFASLVASQHVRTRGAGMPSPLIWHSSIFSGANFRDQQTTCVGFAYTCDNNLGNCKVPARLDYTLASVFFTAPKIRPSWARHRCWIYWGWCAAGDALQTATSCSSDMTCCCDSTIVLHVVYVSRLLRRVASITKALPVTLHPVKTNQRY